MSDAPRNDTNAAEAPAPGMSLVRVLMITGIVLAFGVYFTRQIPEESIAQNRGTRMQAVMAATNERAVAVLAGNEGAARPGDRVDVEDLASGQRRITVRSPVMGSDVMATAVAQGVTIPAPPAQASSPADLPYLTQQASRAAAAAPRYVIEGRRVIEGEDVTGLLVLAPGAELVLTDVVIHGSIVSAEVLGDAAMGSATASIVRIDGAVRIEPGPYLPGVAVMVPGGEVVASPMSSVQMHGDVIASSIDMAGYGSLLGQVASVSTPKLGPNVSRRTRGSHVDRWSNALAHARSVPSYVAFVPASSSWDDVTAMTSFQFP